MNDDDIKCLPDDFVGTSKPSKAIERLNQNRETAERNALENLALKQKDIGEKYEKIIKDRSEELIRCLDDIKGLIKNELFESKTRANNDNAEALNKESFEDINQNIQNYSRERHELIEQFYHDLGSLEIEKSNEFRAELKTTYDEIKKIAFKLPNQIDEFVEFEIEKINQTILCNHRNYEELRNQLHLEVENDSKNFVQELRYVKECWVKFLKRQTDKAVELLKLKSTKCIAKSDSAFLQSSDELKKQTKELKGQFCTISSVTKVQHAEDWLSSIQNTLAKLDYSSQKMLAAYKQAAVLVFNRFFEELRTTAEQLKEMINEADIDEAQAETYTPTLTEIKTQYDVEFETIQSTWNDLVDQLSKIVDNTYKFLVAGSTLWEKHFKRTEILQAITLKDLNNTIVGNNSLTEHYETKLNVLIDNLRQEPSKEKLNKTMEDIKKLLISMEEFYNTQYHAEIGVFKKYKAIQDLRIDILITEIKRFLAVYPPDLEKDPKIQRKRASQTSEIADPLERLIPNQMMYCKYEIGAVSNWQFGLWEAINNYITVAKTEIPAETEQWVKTQTNKLDKRLEIRLAIHSLRLDKITGYIYEVRLEELCIHQSRYEEHKNAVEKLVHDLKEECTKLAKKFGEIYENYTQQLNQLQQKCLELPTSTLVNGNKILLKVKTQENIKNINDFTVELLEKGKAIGDTAKSRDIIFFENMKLFLEGGNFSVQETKDYLKHQSKLEALTEKGLASVRTEIEAAKGKVIANIETRHNEELNILEAIKQERLFNETVQQKLIVPQNEIMEEIFNFQTMMKNLSQTFKKPEINSVVHNNDFNTFLGLIESIKTRVEELKRMGAYLVHPPPVVLYSDKSYVDEQQSRKGDDVDYTAKLFNISIKEEDDSFMMNLNKILFKNWNDIMTYAKGFYSTHPRFYLDDTKMHQSLPALTKEIYEKFLILQNQCETRWIQDSREFLNFLTSYLNIYGEYTELFVEEYAKRTIKEFDAFFVNDIKHIVKSNKEELRMIYVGLHKKMKPMFGHPKNRSLLEKLEIEAQTIGMEAEENMSNLKRPLLEKLQEYYDKAVENFQTLQQLRPKAEQLICPLKKVKDELKLQLNEKVQLLTTFIEFTRAEKDGFVKKTILRHCSSFMNFYEKSERTNMFAYEVFMDDDDEISVVTEKTSTTKTTESLSKTPGESVTVLNMQEDHTSLIDLKDNFDKYWKELVNDDDLEDYLKRLKHGWDNAVKTVLELYKVRYDNNCQ